MTRELPVRLPVAVLALAAAYYAAARMGLLLAFGESNASPVWPPSGIALAALALYGTRLLPGLALGAFAANVAVFAANGAAGWPVIVGASLVIAAGNSLEAWLGVRLMQRWIGLRTPFERLDDVAKFIVVAAAAGAAAAVVGSLTLVSSGIVARGAGATVAFTWWVGDAIGMLTVAPLLMLLPTGVGRGASPMRDDVAALSLAAVLVMLGVLVFGDPATAFHADRRLVWLFLPCVAWAAFRHGPLGVAAVSLGIAGMAVWGTTQGLGPFARGDLNDALIGLQTFVGLVAVTGLVLAADRRERQLLAVRRSVKRDVALPWLVLLASVGITVVGWHLVASDSERRAEERFDYVGADIRDRLLSRMAASEQVLRGGAALFAASQSVEREEWRSYAERLDLPQRFPGIQALGYAERTDVGEREASRVLYIEPVDPRNRLALGLDMLGETARRAAMERARDSGEAALSGKVTLVQEIDEDRQAGTLLYMPVYRNGMPTGSVAERRAALIGWVYSPYRMNNLMRGALGPVADLEGLSVRLYSGAGDDGELSLLFEHRAGARGARSLFSSRTVVEIAGQPWTLMLDTLPRFEATVDLQKAQIVLVAGVVLSLLLFGLVRSLSMTRERAELLAEDKTVALRASERNLQAVLRASPMGVVFGGARGGLRYANPSYLRIAGIADPHATGDVLVSRIHPEDLARVRDGWFAAVTNCASFEVEFRFVHDDGRLVWARMMSAPMVEEGVTLGFVAIVEDTSARVAAAAELATKNEALLRSNAELAQFAYVASHDLKEPLRTVASYSQLLLRRHRERLDDEGQEFLDFIGDGARRAQALIGDLLSLARLDSSASALAPVPLTEVLTHVPRQRGAALEDARAEVGHDPLPVVLGDRGQLVQLLQNLLGNAIKFRLSHAAPSVHVGASREPDGRWRISVSDNGIGIDPRFHDKIFTLFQRLHRADYPGTGIGLAICKKVVERHGGTIGVQSAPGRGSTFFFTIADGNARATERHGEAQVHP